MLHETADATQDEGADAAPQIVPLTEPAGGTPGVVDTPAAYRAAVESLAAGHGPVAVDAERASGYRYGQRAYLVQVNRRGSGIHLVDPTAFTDLSALQEVLGPLEWVLHAASQDLPCLAEVGLHPGKVFDTELAARLLGEAKVGLAAVVARTLGLGLAKEHSAADWSTRPLPASWLTYAALDVAVLLDVRDVLAEELEQAGKAEWAAQEFEAVRAAPPPAPRTDPWRRTSGVHAVRDPRRMAAVRELWTTRDELARHLDVAPGRVLPDAAIVAAAQALPRTSGELAAIRPYSGPSRRRHLRTWQAALDRAAALPPADLPPMRAAGSDNPPPPRAWPERNPEAALRLRLARAAVAETSERLRVPVENMLQPEALRRLCWDPPAPADAEALDARLASYGARAWQRELVVPLVHDAFERAAARRSETAGPVGRR